MRRREYRLYPDAHDTVDALRAAGVKLALVTNGAAETQRAKIDASTSRTAEHIQIEGEFGQGKPELAVYRHALDRLTRPATPGWSGTTTNGKWWRRRSLGMCGIWYDPFETGIPANATHTLTRIIRRLGELLED